MRSITEFKLLFPGEKITTSTIYDWCGGVVSQKSIRRVLQENFKPVGSRKSTYYILKK